MAMTLALELATEAEAAPPVHGRRSRSAA